MGNTTLLNRGRKYQNRCWNTINTIKKNSLSEEAKARISNANSGRIPHNKGKKLDDETILAKMRKPRKTRTCPHCGKTGRGGNMTRYHFDNCEVNDNV